MDCGVAAVGGWEAYDKCNARELFILQKYVLDHTVGLFFPRIKPFTIGIMIGFRFIVLRYYDDNMSYEQWD